MLLDVIHFHSAAHSIDLVYIFYVVEDIGILSQESLVAFEVNRVNLQHDKRITSRI